MAEIIIALVIFICIYVVVLISGGMILEAVINANEVVVSTFVFLIFWGYLTFTGVLLTEMAELVFMMMLSVSWPVSALISAILMAVSVYICKRIRSTEL